MSQREKTPGGADYPRKRTAIAVSPSIVGGISVPCVVTISSSAKYVEPDEVNAMHENPLARSALSWKWSAYTVNRIFGIGMAHLALQKTS
jgi:hypothetical protein